MPWSAGAPFAGFSSAEPWLPIDPRHPPLAVDAEEVDPGSVLAFTRGFLAWRKKHPALIAGAILTGPSGEPVEVQSTIAANGDAVYLPFTIR